MYLKAKPDKPFTGSDFYWFCKICLSFERKNNKL